MARAVRGSNVLVVFLACMAWSLDASATNVQGSVADGTVWNAAGSPYVLLGDVRVPAGATLRVEAGVTVLANTADSGNLGTVPTRVELLVAGTLLVQGTAMLPVRFRSAGVPTRGAWQGVVVQANGVASFTQASVEDTQAALASAGGSLTVRNTTVMRTVTGITGNNAVLDVADSDVVDTTAQAIWAVNGNTQVTRTTVRDCAEGIWIHNEAADNTTTASISHVVVARVPSSSVNFIRANAGAFISLTRSIIYGQPTYLTRSGAFPVDSSENVFFEAINNGLAPGPTDLVENPLFVDQAQNDFRVTANSGARRLTFTGGPTIGRYPYDGAPTPGLVGHLYTNTSVAAGANAQVLGDLTVEPGVTLSVGAGATLRFETNDLMRGGVTGAQSELVVRGTLALASTASQPVTFRSSALNGARNQWYGVRLLGGGTQSYANLRMQDTVVSLRAEAPGSVTVSDALFTQCNTSAFTAVAGVNATLRRLRLTGSACTLALADGVHQVERNISAGVEGDAIGLNFTSTLSSAVLRHNTVDQGASVGLRIRRTSNLSDVTVVDNSVTNTPYGIYVDGPALAVGRNNVWNSNAGAYVNAAPDGTSLSGNPLFVDPVSGDYAPTGNSLLVGTATDGTDVGAVPFGGVPTFPPYLGILRANTTFTRAQSPIVLTGDLVVPQGVTLTVEPGVVIRLGPGDAMQGGADAARAELIVSGTLSAVGEAARPITLEQAVAGQEWYGVRLLAGSGPHGIQNWVLNGARYAVVANLNTPLSLTSVRSQVSQMHVVLGGTGPYTLTGLHAAGGQEGLHIGDGDLNNVGDGTAIRYTVRNSVVRNTASWGVTLRQDNPQADGLLDHNTIHNTVGIWVRRSADNALNIRNNIVSSEQAGFYGVYVEAGPVPTVQFNTLYAENTATFVPQASNANINPLMVSPNNGDMRLQQESPARDADQDGLAQGAVPFVGNEPSAGLVGVLRADRRVTASAQPLLLAGDLEVRPGVTLTVDPGVTLLVADTDAMRGNRDRARVEVRVRGTLSVGGEGAGVVLASVQNAARTWAGITVEPGGTLSTFRNVVVRNVEEGLAIRAGGTVNVEGARFEGGTRGVSVVGEPGATSTVSIRNSVFTALQFAICMHETTYGGTLPAGTEALQVTLSRNTIHAVAQIGVLARNLDFDDRLTADHNTLWQLGNGFHVALRHPAAAVTLTNNSAASYGGYGLFVDSVLVPTARNNNFWQGGSFQPSNVPLALSNFSSNPLHLGPVAGQFRPTHRSPLRFAGDDGSDVGALDYAGDATVGLLGVVHENETLGRNIEWVMTGDLTVPAGRVLSVESGTTILVSPQADAMAAGTPARTELVVNGTLDVRGTPAAPVLMRSFNRMNPTADDWLGIRVAETAPAQTLQDMTVLHARVPFSLASTAGVTLSHVETRLTSGTAVLVESGAGPTVVERSRLLGGARGIRVNGNRARIASNIVTGFTEANQWGIHVTPTGATPDITVINNTVHGNWGGIFTVRPITGDIRVINNAIAAATGSGLTFQQRDPVLRGNNVFNVPGAPYAAFTSVDASNTSADPAFANAAMLDFRPVQGSPLIDRGVTDGAVAGERDQVGRSRALAGVEGGPVLVDQGAVEFDRGGLMALSVDPPVLVQGQQGVMLNVVGQGFADGLMLSLTGTGITSVATVVESSTAARLTVNVGPDAQLGPVNLVQTLSASTSTLFAAVRIQSQPRVTMVSPNRALQGSVTDVTLTGAQFLAGMTAQMGGGGAFLGPVMVGAGGTTATVRVTLTPTAGAGPRVLTLTNADGGRLTLPTGFAVDARAADPVVSSLTPAVVAQGGTLLATLVGSGFQMGARVDVGGMDITVGAVMVDDPQHISVQLAASALADLLPRDVTVTNPDGGVGVLPLGLQVTGPLQFTSLAPVQVEADSTQLPVVLTGLGFRRNMTFELEGSGGDRTSATVASASYLGTTSYALRVTTTASAPLGFYALLGTAPDGATARLDAALEVTGPSAPTLTAVSPSVVPAGLTQVTTTLTGTNFRAPFTLAVSGANVTLTGAALVGSTRITALMSVAPGAALGPRDVTVNVDRAGNASLVAAVTVVGQVTVTSVSPSLLPVGVTGVALTVRGLNLRPDLGFAFNNPGISITSVAASGADVVLTVDVSPTAATGLVDLQVSAASTALASRAGALTLVAPVSLVRLVPDTVVQGARNRTLTAEGTNIPVGTTLELSGTGLTLRNVARTSATTVTGQLDVALTAPTGPVDATLRLPGGFGVTRAAALTVDSGPQIVAANPARLVRGVAEQQVTISGIRLDPGLTWRVDGAGISNVSALFVSSTQVNLQLDVAYTTPSGPRDVVLVRQDGIEVAAPGLLVLYDASNPGDPFGPPPTAGGGGGPPPACQASPGGFTVCPPSLFFLVQEAGMQSATQPLTVNLPGRAPTAFTAVSSDAYVVLSATSGTTPATLDVSVDPATLLADPNTLQATITLSAAGAPDQVVAVQTLVKDALGRRALLEPVPSAISIQVAPGQAAEPVLVRVVSQDERPYAFTTLAQPNTGIQVTPGSGTTPQTLSVLVDTDGLALRDAPYTWVVQLIAPDTEVTPVLLPVRVQVRTAPPPGRLAVTPSSLVLSVPAGSTAPVTTQLSVSANGGADVDYTAAVQGAGSPWLDVEDTPRRTPGVVRVTVNPAQLTGTAPYLGTVRLSAGSDTVDVPVRVVVGQPLPVCRAGENQRRDPTRVELDGSASTPATPGGTVAYAWKQVSGPPVTLSGPTTARPTFVARAPGVVVLELACSDANGNPGMPSSTSVIIRDVPPSAYAGPDLQYLLSTPARVLTLQGAFSRDGNGDALRFAWKQLAGPTVALSDVQTSRPTFSVSRAGQYTFELTVRDPAGNVGVSTVTHTVHTAEDTVPTARIDAPERVLTAEVFTLGGSASSPGGDGSQLTYAWRQVGGPVGLLENDTQVDARFSSPSPGLAEFELVVTDATGLRSLPALASVRINASNDEVPVTAVAQALIHTTVGTVVELDARPSTNGVEDPQGTQLNHLLRLVEGPRTELYPTAQRGLWRMAPVLEGTYRLTVRAQDGNGAGRPVDIHVVVDSSTAHVPRPSAATLSAGTVGQSLTLSTSDTTDTDNQFLKPFWVQVAGVNVGLADPGATLTDLRPRVAGPLRFQMRLTDGEFISAPFNVEGTVGADPNRAPTANAGTDVMASVATPVLLNGSASVDPDGDALAFHWEAAVGFAGLELTGTDTATPSFTAYVAGAYTLTLVVSDGRLQSAPDTVRVLVSGSGGGGGGNLAPVANAGEPRDVLVNTPVTLNGAASVDPNGDSLAYRWQVTGPGSPPVDRADQVEASFVPTTQGIYRVQLTVQDPGGLRDTVQVDLNALQTLDNQPPVANAGMDVTVPRGGSATLDGSASTDPDGNALSHTWTLLSGPVPVSGLTPNMAQVTLTFPYEGLYAFKLVVSDGVAASEDTVVVEVLANGGASSSGGSSGGGGSSSGGSGSGGSSGNGGSSDTGGSSGGGGSSGVGGSSTGAASAAGNGGDNPDAGGPCGCRQGDGNAPGAWTVAALGMLWMCRRRKR